MRVISGSSKGTKLESIESNLTRPTLDRVKESLFNIIQNELKNKNVLDLFAGSGALGIEALSRGANKSYFCDINIQAIKVLEKNLEKTRLKDKSIIINKDYKLALEQIKDKLDIVFLDPPYKLDLAVKSIKQILELNLLNQDFLIIIETDEDQREIKELEEISEIEIIDRRKYGRVYLIFIKKRGK